MHAMIAATVVALVSAGAAVTATQMGHHVAPPAVTTTLATTTTLVKPVRLVPDSGGGAALTSTDRRGIEDAVRVQIRAFATQDAEQAFANLAPSTQRFFGKPDRLLESIAEQTPPILLTRSFSFLGAEQTGNRITQQVLLTDRSGQDWLAEFQVEREKAGNWRVKGCVIEAAPGQQA
jgi:uncharacterized protein DUF4864